MPPTAPASPKSTELHVYGAAAELFSSTNDEIVLSGPAGTGKSLACLQYLHFLASTYPGTRGLIARKTRESITQTALVTYEEKVLSKAEYRRIASGVQRRVRQSYRYPNGSEIVVGGLDKPTKIMSTEFDCAYVQEAIELTENDWESITTRLRNGVTPHQQLIGDTNPDGPQHWLKQRANANKLLMLESRHEDNPAYWNIERDEPTEKGAAYLAKLDALTGVRKPRLRYGKWVQAEGTVYDGWDRKTHVIDRFPIPSDWRRIRAFDFGLRNPFVCLWIALDDDCRMYVYRELYHTNRTVKVHAEQINEKSEGESYEFSVSDHDASVRATLLENGIATIPARKDVDPGIQAVQERLKLEADERPRLFYLRDSLLERDPDLVEAKMPCSMIEEIDGYIWKKDPSGQIVKDEPLKKDDHAMDALRYAVMAVDRGVTAIEPPHIIEARERKAQEEAEARHRDINNPDWWQDNGGGGW